MAGVLNRDTVSIHTTVDSLGLSVVKEIFWSMYIFCNSVVSIGRECCEEMYFTIAIVLLQLLISTSSSYVSDMTEQ